MGLISPGGENLLDFFELRQVLSTYDGDLRDPLWWPQERPEELRVVPPFPEPPDVSVDSRETCFPPNASTFKPRIDSELGGTRESPVKSLVGKPRGKAY